MEHSKLPWTISRGAQQYPFSIESEIRTVAFIKMQSERLSTSDAMKTTEANAEFIVKACNAHYDLLEALDLISGGLMNGSPNNPERQRKALLNIALKAIAKAKGTEKKVSCLKFRTPFDLRQYMANCRGKRTKAEGK